MSERFASDLLFIIIVLLIAAILGFIIGYLISQYQKRKAVKLLEDQISVLDSKLSSCMKRRNELELEADDLRRKLEEAGSAGPQALFDHELAKKVLGKKIAADDLKIIEGIGPKIQEILNDQGIDSWLKLSMANPDEIRSLLIDKGGPRYQIHDPGTWPAQAKLAATGKWQELKEFQDQLLGGK